MARGHQRVHYLVAGFLCVRFCARHEDDGHYLPL